MIKPKSIIISVCVGFALSFIIGLIASVSFGVVLLRAIIFAVLFGVLGFGVGIVFKRFLLDSSDLDGSSESVGVSKQGSVVDLSVGDEPLVEDENGPDFYVRKDVSQQNTGGNVSVAPEKSSVSSGEVIQPEEKKPVEVSSSEPAPVQFQPISLGGVPLGSLSEETSVSGSTTVGSSNDDKAGDVLPEIGDISITSTENDEGFSSGGMDLAIGNGMETSQGRGVADTSSDPHTIAQAIRTVLARDS